MKTRATVRSTKTGNRLDHPMPAYFVSYDIVFEQKAEKFLLSYAVRAASVLNLERMTLEVSATIDFLRALGSRAGYDGNSKDQSRWYRLVCSLGRPLYRAHTSLAINSTYVQN